MRLDYKFSSIIRDGETTKCVVRFYEGNITTEKEKINETLQDVTRYRRSKLLRTETHTFKGDRSDEQLQNEFNEKLSQDTVRLPIDEQNAKVIR